jgi:excisionase family DNA binding protein
MFYEPFVDSERAAEFMNLKPRYVLELARKGRLPAYPFGNGARHTWRFLLSELSAAAQERRAVTVYPASAKTA